MDPRHPVGGVGLVVATAALWTAAGPVGLVAGLGALLAWAAASAPYAFAAGQVLAVVALPDGAPIAAVVAVELGLLAVLAGPLLRTAAPAPALATFGVATAGLAGVALVVQPPWLAVLTLAAVAALAAYGVHRGERVALGLVEGVD